MPQILNSVDFTKIQKSRFLENKTFFFLQLKKSLLTYQGLRYGKNSFVAEVTSKCLIDRSIKICNNWNSFYNDIENIKFNLIKNAYLPFLINKVIKRYLDYKFSSSQNQLKDKSDNHYFKLPYIGNLSHHTKYKISKLCKEFCKENFNIKLVFKGIVK